MGKRVCNGKGGKGKQQEMRIGEKSKKRKREKSKRGIRQILQLPYKSGGEEGGSELPPYWQPGELRGQEVFPGGRQHKLQETRTLEHGGNNHHVAYMGFQFFLTN